MSKPRVVTDCNVFLRAFISSKSISYRIFRLAEDHHIELFTSRYTLTELAEVLSRPEFPEKFPHFTPENWLFFLNKIRKCSSYIRYVEPEFELTRDKKDAPYIDLASKVAADYIVTYDHDLLDLMTGTDIESKRFRQRFRNLKILRPDEFLRIVSESGLSLKP